MTSEHELIERAIRAWATAEPSFDTLVLRRDRKHRHAKIRAAVLALVIAAASMGLVARMLGLTEQPAAHETWSRVSLIGLLPQNHEHFWGLTFWKGKFVAVAERPSSHGLAMSLITSTDALHWTRAPAIDPSPGAYVSDLTTDGPELIASGSDRQGGAIWTSDDAITWRRISLGGPVGKVFGVTVAGGRYFAWGQSGFFVTPHHERVANALWTSTDGRSWSPASAADGHAFGEFTDVAAGGPGFVASAIPPGGAEPQPQLWTSPDGSRWTLLLDQPPLSDGGISGSVDQVMKTDGGLVAFGSEFDSNHVASVMMWTSADGLTWSAARLGDGDPSFSLHDVLQVGPGFIGVGNDAVWSSPDGSVWTQDASAPGCVLTKVTEGPAGMVAVGEGTCMLTTAGGS